MELLGEGSMVYIVLLVIGCVYSVLPMDEINNLIFPIDNDVAKLPYSEAKLEFDADYDRLNPFTKNTKLKEYAIEKRQNK
jgi:hypothetical protein